MLIVIQNYLFARRVRRLHKQGAKTMVELYDTWQHIGNIKLPQYF